MVVDVGQAFKQVYRENERMSMQLDCSSHKRVLPAL